MKIIKEISTSFGNAYEIYSDNILVTTINFIRVNKEYNEFNYLFLIDTNGYVIDNVYDFLNIKYKYNSINSREQTLTFLKLLYSFKEILGKPFEMFDRKDIDLLSSFIQGESIEGNFISFKLVTKRAISTHNQYFNIMRNYFKYLDIKNKALFEKKTVATQKGGYGMMSHTKKTTITTFATNKSRHQSFTIFVPKFIKLSEFHEIIEFIDKQDKSKLLKMRNRIIIELMYGCGLRIGEVLGITLEDLELHPDNKDTYIIYIRNRLSDKEYQKAKTCYRVKSKDDYTHPEYNKKDTGYQMVLTNKKLKDSIDKYIKLSTNITKVSDTVLDNIMNFATADCVTEQRKENRYIFLNKNGTPLSTSGWNKELKFIFKKLNIACDSKKRKDNLSHRFRHGFAMFLMQEGYPIDEIQRRLRHSNISSTQIYTNPTKEDILKKSSELDKIMWSKRTCESLNKIKKIKKVRVKNINLAMLKEI